MSATKRRHYRVTGHDLDGIHVSFRVGRLDHPVQLMDISSAGAAIAFIGENRDTIKEKLAFRGTPPQFVIESASLDAPLTIQCRVVHAQEMEAGVICGVAFLRQIDDTFNLEGALLKVFNRRGAVRVEPDPDQPVRVQILTSAGRAIAGGLLKDLSLTGLGVTVAPSQMSALKSGADIKVRFSLRGREFMLGALVRFTTVREALKPGAVTPEEVGIVGLEFDLAARNDTQTRKHLADWVMWRQREIQRIQRELAESTSS